MLLKLAKEADCAEIQQALMFRKIYTRYRWVIMFQSFMLLIKIEIKSYHSNRNNKILNILSTRSVELREGNASLHLEFFF